MLTAADFRVDLDPTLDTDRIGVAESANQALAALNARLAEVDEPHEIATEVRAFFDPDHGALNQVASVLSAVSEHAQAAIGSFSENDPGYRLWHQVEAASEVLCDLRDELAAVPDTLHTLTTGQGLALYEAARAQSPSLTAAPAAGRTVSPSPATPAAPAPSAAPDRGRTR
ncbi:hypothetical protein FF041_36255 [Streptomyces jumonjinensis]|uniref:Uncharacterized protein n=3 Tax=Streptomyces jumonjinensis TaxID=1945 RepID=A0A646KSR1_STRJU|nr:hypothetical protein [Streptomyces jumonjinensis]